GRRQGRRPGGSTRYGRQQGATPEWSRRSRLARPPADGRGQVGRTRVVEVSSQVLQPPLQVDHSAASVSATLSRSRARDRRDLTVPAGLPVTRAVSCVVSSRK